MQTLTPNPTRGAGEHRLAADLWRRRVQREREDRVPGPGALRLDHEAEVELTS